MEALLRGVQTETLFPTCADTPPWSGSHTWLPSLRPHACASLVAAARVCSTCVFLLRAESSGGRTTCIFTQFCISLAELNI